MAAFFPYLLATGLAALAKVIIDMISTAYHLKTATQPSPILADVKTKSLEFVLMEHTVQTNRNPVQAIFNRKNHNDPFSSFNMIQKTIAGRNLFKSTTKTANFLLGNATFDKLSSIIHKAGILLKERKPLIDVMKKGDNVPIRLNNGPKNLLEFSVITSRTTPNKIPSYYSVASYFEQRKFITKMCVVNLPIQQCANNLISTNIMTDGCQNYVLANVSKPSCNTHKVTYPPFQIIAAKNSEILIFVQQYSFISLECQDELKNIKNEGILVLEVKGKITIKYKLNQIYQTKSANNNCQYKILRNQPIALVLTHFYRFYNTFVFEISRDIVNVLGLLPIAIYLLITDFNLRCKERFAGTRSKQQTLEDITVLTPLNTSV
jgi:hypothetical protein